MKWITHQTAAIGAALFLVIEGEKALGRLIRR